jgi:fatty-acyl-CoA synthase
MTPQLTPLSMLRRSEVVFADRTAVVDRGDRFTYRELGERCRRQAGLLASRGVRSGDRVAVLAPNTRMLLEAHYGVAMADGVLVALNIRLAVDELARIIAHSGATVLLFDETLRETASRLDVAVKIGSDEYENALSDSPQVAGWSAGDTTLLALNYTSGTSGTPKGVMYHHGGAYLQALAMAYHRQLDPSTVHLWTLPMFHCNGWSFTWAVTAAGGVHVCLDRVVPSDIWSAMETEGVNSFNAAPTVLLDLVSAPEAHRLKQVRIATGGAPPSLRLIQELGDLGMEVDHLYGLTETFGPSVVCAVPPELRTADSETQARYKARQGNANIAGVPVRVVDSDGVDVPADGNSLGEILVGGPTIALGYYKDEAATAAAFVDGWLYTGDLGVRHPDANIELKDRMKDVIISGGENVASVEVEKVIEQHPAVLECAVVAAPDKRWGEVPVAFVVLRPGATVTDAELTAHVRASLAGFKAPKQFYYGPLPKTATGKVRKHELRAAIVSGSAPQGDA